MHLWKIIRAFINDKPQYFDLPKFLLIFVLLYLNVHEHRWRITDLQ